jgi:hypothetical protein
MVKRRSVFFVENVTRQDKFMRHQCSQAKKGFENVLLITFAAYVKILLQHISAETINFFYGYQNLLIKRKQAFNISLLWYLYNLLKFDTIQ